MQADVSYHISIPYGSIKSMETLKTSPQMIVFQFLMVRLKGVKLDSSVSSREFQFLMVRLKVGRRECHYNG